MIFSFIFSSNVMQEFNNLFLQSELKNSDKSDKGDFSKTELKYAKPKILSIDLSKDITDNLKTEGFNISVGSFGTPYEVPVSDNYSPVIAEFDLPNYEEQEIFIIDLVPNTTIKKPKGKKWTSDGEIDWWKKCSSGVIDPRPRIMLAAEDKLKKSLKFGHIFVIFADAKETQEIVLAQIPPYSTLKIIERVEINNWCFLQLFDSGTYSKRYAEVLIQNGNGYEMFPFPSDEPVIKLLSNYLDKGSYNCVFTIYDAFEHNTHYRFEPLAYNKFEQIISFKLKSIKEPKTGSIYVFPQIDNKAEFLVRLLKEILPTDSPNLFPYFEGNLWLKRKEYQLPKVIELEQDKIKLEEEIKLKLERINQQIEEEKISNKYLSDLLTETGDPLVAAVKKCLEILGFKNVIDVDEEKTKSGDTSQLREDLRIEDDSPIILTEIKGINNLPKESQSLQVWKYIAPRIKKLGRTDVRGLSIINHQRRLPPLERENIHTFGEDILTNAEEQEFGLLTTWDLYRLTRSFINNGWKHENVKDLFYRNGRIAPIPDHYEYIGKTDEFFERAEVIGIHIESGSISEGDYIAFQLPVEFQEEKISSIQLDKNSINSAGKGQYVGIKTILNKSQAKRNMLVFKVSK